jgi:tetratricopeptide (TPR) repeat protein
MYLPVEEKPRMQPVDRASQIFRKAIRDFYRARFDSAEHCLRRAQESFASSRNWSGYFDASAYLVRLEFERQREVSPFIRREQLQRIVDENELDLVSQAKAYFVLGLLDCAAGNFPEANIDFDKSLSFADKAKENKARVAPLYGLAYAADASGDIDLAFSYLKKVTVLLELNDHPEYYTKTLLMKCSLYERVGKYDHALKEAWQAYRTLVQAPNFVLYVTTLEELAKVYLAKKDIMGARHYLELAQQAVAGSELKRTTGSVQETLARLEKRDSANDYDYIFEVDRGVLINRNGSKLNFGGQFVMQDLLALFAKSPGRSFSKEEIVSAVWSEVYDPTSHNNKLYVTIRRMRRMLQQMDLSVPSSNLIIRSKEGYRLDPEVHVQLL